MNKVLDVLKKNRLDSPEGILFLLAVKYQGLHPDLPEFCLENFSSANKVAKLVMQYRSGKIEFKDEFFEEDEFTNFIKMLIAKDEDGYVIIDTRGHINNPLPYAIGLFEPNTRQEFDIIRLRYPDVKLDYLVQKTTEYYEKAEYPKKLNNFIRTELQVHCI